MLTINRNLDEKVGDIDRAYLTDEDLLNVEKFVTGFPVRVKTYNLLRDLSDELVLRSISLLAQQYPELVQKSSRVCKYDMSLNLRYVALSILRDDELFFREALIDWHANIIHSYGISKEVSVAYCLLRDITKKIAPPECFSLINPYFEVTISAFQKSS
jgi:Phycobilisome protein